MSEARPASFRSVGTAQRAPGWMTAHHESVSVAAFPRHGEIAPVAPEIPEAPVEEMRAAPISDVAPIPEARVPSIPAPPPAPAPAEPSPALLDALTALATAREEAMADARRETLSLAVDVARALLDTELESRPELHQSLVKAALDVLGPTATPRVRVAAAAFDAMVAALGGRTFELDGRRLELELDPTLTGAGVVLDAGDAHVDGTVDARLTAVRTALALAAQSDRRRAA